MVWERVGAATGILFVVVFIAAFSIQQTDFPDPGLASAPDIVMFVEANQLRLGWTAALYAVSWTAFLWFLGSLRSMMGSVETPPRLSAASFGGGLVTAGLFFAMAGLKLELTLADFTTAQDAAVVSRWAIFDASDGLFGITPFPRAVFLGSASMLTLRFGGLPRWLGWFGIGAAIVNLVGGLDYFAPSGVSYTGSPLADLVLFLLWVLLASALLVRHPRPTRLAPGS